MDPAIEDLAHWFRDWCLELEDPAILAREPGPALERLLDLQARQVLPYPVGVEPAAFFVRVAELLEDDGLAGAGAVFRARARAAAGTSGGGSGSTPCPAPTTRGPEQRSN